MPSPSSYLLILGEGAAVAWVLTTSQMAFPPTRRAEVDRLAVGDELLIFTTRSCWHNPTRDRGRVVGRASVTGPVTPYDTPVEIAGREFTRGCPIRVEELAPFPAGVELAPLVPRLSAFPSSAAWGIRLRRPLLALSPGDATLVREALAPLVGDPATAIPGYLAAARRITPAKAESTPSG